MQDGKEEDHVVPQTHAQAPREFPPQEDAFLAPVLAHHGGLEVGGFGLEQVLVEVGDRLGRVGVHAPHRDPEGSVRGLREGLPLGVRARRHDMVDLEDTFRDFRVLGERFLMAGQDQDVGVQPDDLALEVDVEPVHDRQHDRQGHHADGHAPDREPGEDGHGRALALGAQVPKAQEDLERHFHVASSSNEMRNTDLPTNILSITTKGTVTIKKLWPSRVSRKRLLI